MILIIKWYSFDSDSGSIHYFSCIYLVCYLALIMSWGVTPHCQDYETEEEDMADGGGR